MVEDEPAVRAPLEKFLAIHGFDVRGAATAEAALRIIAERRPDAAVIDLRLPQGSGRDVVLSIAPGVGTPVKGGLDYREAHMVMEIVADSGLLRALDLVEVNPILDDRNMTAILAAELASSALGQKII